MGRLVVGHVLPGNGQAVLWVVHQGYEAVIGGNGRGEETQFLAVDVAEDNLFAPVA
jgi:hypothetical protein